MNTECFFTFCNSAEKVVKVVTDIFISRPYLSPEFYLFMSKANIYSKIICIFNVFSIYYDNVSLSH